MKKPKYVYRVRWDVPVVDKKTYTTLPLEQVFRHKRTANMFRNQLISAYTFIGIDLPSSYVRLIEEEVI